MRVPNFLPVAKGVVYDGPACSVKSDVSFASVSYIRSIYMPYRYQGRGVDEISANPTPTPTPACKYRLRLRFDSGITWNIQFQKEQYNVAIFVISFFIISKQAIGQQTTRSR